MAKIKVFKFEVSNSVYGISREEYNHNTSYYDKCIDRLSSLEQIEDTINSFLEDKELISLNTNTVDVNYHNNGYRNTVELVYTITYNNK